MKLNKDQEHASEEFTQFLLDDQATYFVINGKAGSGKSTLIKHLINTLDQKCQIVNLLQQKKQTFYDVALTATTNKAVAVLDYMKNVNIKTIHSFLNLTVRSNFVTGSTDLQKNKNWLKISNFLIIIDEASFIDNELFEFLEETTQNCKIVLVGDQYQLAPIHQKQTIMESLDCQKVTLNEIMRNSGSIASTGEQFKETVHTGVFNPIIPNGSDLITVDGPTFQSMIEDSFSHRNYKNNSAKVLAWTNSKVIAYNHFIRNLRGYPKTFQEGELVITNKPIILGGGHYSHIDSHVQLVEVGYPCVEQGVPGMFVCLSNGATGFLPTDHQAEKALLKKLAAKKNWHEYFTIKEGWLDLRPAYASTVHKSQGSTYDTVYIDLTDIGKCNIPSDVARMIYVAITRASKQVVLYGKLPVKYTGEYTS